MEIEKLVQTAESLENIMVRCFGPHGRQVLLVRDTGDILITKDGCRILESLLLEHPAARLMVQCVSAHCSLAGDGAKSFILLLAAMLRASRAEIGDGLPAHHGAQRLWLARGLAKLVQEVLEPVLARHLAPRCGSALCLSSGHPLLPREQAARVLAAYFGGKVSPSHTPFLTQLACDFLQRLGDGEMEPALNLAANCFPGLHVTVPGLPVGSSRVLEGLLLSRGFSLLCGQGETRVLVVDGSLLPPLTEAGYTLQLESAAGLAEARDWARARAEEALARLRALGVGLLLSGSRQPACVLELARRQGLSVVDCLPDEDLCLVRRLTGVGPLSQVADARPADTVPAGFARPAPLGTHEQVLVGFLGCCGLRAHSLAVCAPALGLAMQHRDAIHGAFKLLRFLLPHPGHHDRESKKLWTGDLEKGSERQGTGDLERESGKQGTGNLAKGGMRQETGNLERGSERQETGDLERESERQETEDLKIGSEIRGTRDFGQECEKQGMWEPGKAEDLTEGMLGTGGKGGKHHQPVDQLARREPWELSECELPAGRVLPPGGTFEFLMHHYLQREADSQQQPDVRAACRIVADALLNVPRHLHPRADRGRDFLQAHTNFAANLREQGVPAVVDGPLEVVAAKQCLLVSVIRCLRRLLAIDRVIAVRGKLGNKLPTGSEVAE
ncbi:Bardet-Biedl syndrome 10 protein [Scyliorhinus torazame]|uniref:Bardet-Biedl syndrome 10 protein n=1 Tax=Scyliorhinus torazame TaxID=75743 RepID=UPI003B5A294A